MKRVPMPKLSVHVSDQRCGLLYMAELLVAGQSYTQCEPSAWCPDMSGSVRTV